MKKNNLLLLLLVLSVFGCTKPGEDPLPGPDPNPNLSQITANKSQIVFDYYLHSDTITIDAPGSWQADVEYPLIEYYNRWLSVSRLPDDSSKLIIYGGSELRQTTDLVANIAIKLADGTDTNALRIPALRSAISRQIFAFGGEGDDAFNSIVMAPLEYEAVVAGYSSSGTGDLVANKGGKDVWIMKIRFDGTKVWSRSYGGSGDDVATAITTSHYRDDMDVSVDGYLIAGYTNSNDGDVSGNHGGRDAWIMNIDNDGNLRWQRTLGGAGDDEIVQISEGAGINTLLGGTKDGDQWMLRVDHDGNITWEKTFGSSGQDYAGSVFEALSQYWFTGSGIVADGDVADKPTTSEDAWVVKMTEDGTVLWKNYIAGAGIDKGISTGGGVLYGNTRSADIFSDFTGTQNIFLAKFDDNNGTLLSKKIIKHTDFDELKTLAGTRHGYSTLLAGKSVVDGSLDNSDESLEAFILETTNDGDILSNRKLGGSGSVINQIIHGGGAGRATFVGSTSQSNQHGDPGKNGWFGWIECR